MENKYIKTMLEKYICYFKNGELHRENGPAVYLPEDKSKYDNVADKDLYKSATIDQGIKEIFILFDFRQGTPPYYYLEGTEYDKQTFDAIIEKQQIQKDLSVELSTSQINMKRTKI